MRSIRYFLGEANKTIKINGLGSLFVRSGVFLKNRAIYIVKGRPKRKNFKDVLFINGCTLEHPKRYRVEHQIEQLEFNGFSCESIFYEHLRLEDLKYYRTFIFFRCPVTPNIETFISNAKNFNKKVFFDIDDLVIDFEYVKEIKYLNTMSKDEYSLYMDGVERMKKTLLMCDYAVTTTETLGNELKKYVNDVYINKNVASEQMLELSESALAIKEEQQSDGKIRMGYLSGSITHNADFEIIKSTILKLLNENKNLKLVLVGLLDVPEEFKKFSDQIEILPFTKWTNLPKIISNLDINLVPLENNIFNEAKSENKWTEASLVKVVTIASAVGPYKHILKSEDNGMLCYSEDDWYIKLKKLIKDEKLRKDMANKSYNIAMSDYISANTGYGLFEYIESKINKNIGFVVPSTNISGGINVIIKHSHFLKKSGYDVLLISMDDKEDNVINSDGELNVISLNKTDLHAHFPKLVGTLWSTVSLITSYPKASERYYLVQNHETNFYKPNNFFRKQANLTYNSFFPIKYITISKWCENWLKDDYKKDSKYAPNGIDINKFSFKERNFDGKIRILIEGNSKDHYKNVDESFKITNELDRNKFEVWYISYFGGPKDWYKVDKYFLKVPYDEIGEIYRQCHILLKSSKLESFSYPPLEMISTGGIAIVAPNGGNVEYLKDGENCIFYELGNINDGINKILDICENQTLRSKLIENGLKTSKERQWENIENDILSLYDV